MRGWVAEMVTFKEGEEVSVDDDLEWTVLTPTPGWVIEVYMGGSSHTTLSETWAAFYIMSTDNESDGSHMLTVKFLGAEDVEVGQELQTKFHRGGKIHMCLSRPCLEVRPTEALHVTKVRFWTWDNFKEVAEYLIAGIGRSVSRWKKEIEDKQKAPADPRRVVAPKKTASKPKRKEAEASQPKESGGGEKAPKGLPPVGSGLTAEMKTKLKAKLGDIKKKVRGTGGVAPEGDGAPTEVTEIADSDDETSGPVPTTPPDEAMNTGTALVARGPELGRPGHRKKKDKKGTLAIKDSGTKSLSAQLIRRAMVVTNARKAATKKKKHKKDKKNKVVELLSQILTGKSDKKRKKEKDGKKRRTRRDGVIESCSTTSSKDSADSDSQESDEDLEAPMKKRSRDRPGSVLAMLTEHIRHVMEQAATTDLPDGDQGVTGGIKVASYFQMHVKPQYPTYLRELREMHSLAATLDLLRSGDVARVGDSLSARFMALHQSMIDQNWGTARFMELHSMDESSAASAGMILASRKHSRLVDKVQGKGWNYNYWGGRGKGRGKNDWKGHQEDAKGEKGKGKKGKKGRNGKWQGDPTWDKKVTDWEKSKEKPDDKA